MVEVWYRNAEPYVREALEHGATLFAFNASFLERRSVDIDRFADLFLAPPLDYRMLVIAPDGTAELRRGWTRARPKAVYPTWDYKLDDIATLEELIATPVGADWAACNDTRCGLHERPVYGQEHRVVITSAPGMQLGIGRRFASTIRDLQAEYPTATLHMTGLASFRVMFGLDFKSIDLDPFELGRGDMVMLPNGKRIHEKDVGRWAKWIALLGFKNADLKVPRNRTLYNMRSAEWAAEHFKEDIPFRSRGKIVVDPDAKDHVIPTTLSPMSKQVNATVGDKVHCDTCSLAPSCKYFRDGQVCSLPQSETASLAKLFRSRDADQVIDGLGAVLSVHTERLEHALDVEVEFGGKDGTPLDPEVTRLANSLFDRGVTMAKLLAPGRFTGPKVAISVGGSAQAVETPQVQMARTIQELKGQGYTIDQITPELIASFNPQVALPAPPDVVIEVEDDGEEPDDSEF